MVRALQRPNGILPAPRDGLRQLASHLPAGLPMRTNRKRALSEGPAGRSFSRLDSNRGKLDAASAEQPEPRASRADGRTVAAQVGKIPQRNKVLQKSYRVERAVVLCESNVSLAGKVRYPPVYMAMCL